MTRILIPRYAGATENPVTGEGVSSIVLPPSLLAETKYRCRVVVDVDGTICGRPFFDGQRRQFELHCAACAREHHDVIVAYMKRRHPEVMNPWDTDLASWIRKHSTEILEGRKKM